MLYIPEHITDILCITLHVLCTGDTRVLSRQAKSLYTYYRYVILEHHLTNLMEWFLSDDQATESNLGFI